MKRESALLKSAIIILYSRNYWVKSISNNTDFECFKKGIVYSQLVKEGEIVSRSKGNMDQNVSYGAQTFSDLKNDYTWNLQESGNNIVIFKTDLEKETNGSNEEL